MFNLEGVAEGELHIALAELARHLSKIRIGRIRFGGVPVRMVGPVEGLDPELKLALPLDDEIFEEGHVVVLKAGTEKEIANPLLIEGTCCRPHKDRRAIGILRLKPVVLIGAGLGELFAVGRSRITLHDPELRAATWPHSGEVIAGSD